MPTEHFSRQELLKKLEELLNFFSHKPEMPHTHTDLSKQTYLPLQHSKNNHGFVQDILKINQLSDTGHKHKNS